ncbi:hypothetical protein MUK42_22089 [Musa troglodytarum]|uniref:Uncharacterized protein n=1 Tax=Musa troglodytarum TaxID=320322 RepID=A0A9E7FJZ7_9LILI|nr:hypothetical protein MUK42_22089 [Musa troglodytarum]
MSLMIFIYLDCPQRDGSSLSSTVMLQADLHGQVSFTFSQRQMSL